MIQPPRLLTLSGTCLCDHILLPARRTKSRRLHLFIPDLPPRTAAMGSVLDEPALTPPPGVVPNFADTGGSRSIGYGIVIASSAISTIAVLARLLSSTVAKKFVLEDFLMLAALVGGDKFKKIVKSCAEDPLGSLCGKSIHHLRPHYLSWGMGTSVEHHQ